MLSAMLLDDLMRCCEACSGILLSIVNTILMTLTVAARTIGKACRPGQKDTTFLSWTALMRSRQFRSCCIILYATVRSFLSAKAKFRARLRTCITFSREKFLYDVTLMCCLNVSAVDACVSDPCQNFGSCVDMINAYHCECIPGFTGINCERS